MAVLKIDLDLTTKDLADLTSPDALAAFLSRLGYDTSRRTVLTPTSLGLSGDTATSIRSIELLSEDDDGFLRGCSFRIDDLADPQELVDLWAFGSWLCNIDRELEGNILLALSPDGRFRLVAADQSDCLGGSGRFADGSWITVMANARSRGNASVLPACYFRLRRLVCHPKRG